VGFVWDAGIGLQHLVVTASGPDRPGIVARLSKRVLDCGGNMEISRMARLAGEFSVLMLVTFDIT
jgi:glycine cleavage system transcriptional repressor